MSKPINNGGPAFPNKDELGNMIPGMSLRDYFAGQALAGLLTQPAEDEYGPKCFAEAAYEMADAMLKARNKEVAP